MLIWSVAAVLAYIHGFVAWPLWITWAVLILIIDHKVSPDSGRLRHGAGVVLLLAMLLALVALTVLSVLAWQSRMLA